MSEPEVTIRAWDSGRLIDVEYCDENGRRVEEFQGLIRIKIVDTTAGRSSIINLVRDYGVYDFPIVNDDFGGGCFGNITVDHNSLFPIVYGNVRNMEPKPEVQYGDDMPGMTLDEFQTWSDRIIREVQDAD